MLVNQEFYVEALWRWKKQLLPLCLLARERWCKKFDKCWKNQSQKTGFRHYLGGLLGGSERKNRSQMANNSIEPFQGFYAIANLLSISRIKHRLILAVALLRVLSKFLVKLLHLSIQELVLSMTHLALTGTNPIFPCCFFSTFDGFGDSFNRILVIIAG